MEKEIQKYSQNSHQAFKPKAVTHDVSVSGFDILYLPSLSASFILASCSINHFNTRWPAGCSAIWSYRRQLSNHYLLKKKSKCFTLYASVSEYFYS